MDFNQLRDTVSNLTLYDIKAGVRKVQNAVMNYTEMEAKVREATNNEPWGASSTIMQEIANGTFNYQTLNEIMPMIYRRFTEKAAEEWRQIYKALQLLEFLIKHGSERVIDDARSHLTLLKMLRQFHYIDQNGKDQGINVRNRAKELAELLGDVDRIRMERKKARATKSKYTGVEGGMGMGGSMSSSSRYGGFGNESGGAQGSDAYGTYSGRIYGDGGGFGGQSSDVGGGGGSRADKFEEYDEFDEGERPSAASRSKQPERTGPPKKSSEPAKKKQPEVDLFSFDDPVPTAPATSSSASGAQPGLSALGSLSSPAGNAMDDDDDEFDDFQSATPAASAPASSGSAAMPLSPPLTATSAAPTTRFAAPQPLSAPKQTNLQDMVNLASISPAPTPVAAAQLGGPNYSSFAMPPITPAAASAQPPQAAGRNYFQSVQATSSQQSNANTLGGSSMASLKPASTSSAASKPAAGGDAFGALWSQASTGIKKSNTPTNKQAMGQLAREKSSASIWGTSSVNPSASSQPAGSAPSTGGNGLDDLLG